MLRISFIVPAYNCELYIERCIDSILRQKLDLFEIIIVDDGSTDNTGNLCDKIAENHPEIKVFHTENSGVSVARNVGIQNSSGNYLAFIDSDDYYKDGTVETLLDKAEKSNLDIVCGDYTEINEDKVIPYDRQGLDQRILDGESFVQKALTNATLPMVVWLSLFRREFITEKKLFFRPGYYYEDELWVSQAYLLAGSVCYCPVNFYGYFIHNQSATHGKKYNKNAKYIITICEELKEFSKHIQNIETQKLFQNVLVSNYLSGYYLSKMPACDINPSFFDHMYLDSRNTKRVTLLLHAPRIYWYANYFSKLITAGKEGLIRNLKTYQAYCHQAFYLLRKIIREYTTNQNEKRKLRNHSFSLISNTCNGGVIVSELGEQFRSPTVNLYIDSDDFLELLEHFEEYMGMELKEVTNRFVPYPVGELGSVKIYFMHYKSFLEAKQKWDERKSRIHYNNLYILMVQRNGCEDEHVIRFDNLKFPNKVIFTIKEYENLNSTVYAKQFKNDQEVDILTDCIGLLGKRKYDYLFDYVSWLNKGGAGRRFQK